MLQLAAPATFGAAARRGRLLLLLLLLLRLLLLLLRQHHVIFDAWRRLHHANQLCLITAALSPCAVRAPARRPTCTTAMLCNSGVWLSAPCCTQHPSSQSLQHPAPTKRRTLRQCKHAKRESVRSPDSCSH
jgi:hypothetical protein